MNIPEVGKSFTIHLVRFDADSLYNSSKVGQMVNLSFVMTIKDASHIVAKMKWHATRDFCLAPTFFLLTLSSDSVIYMTALSSPN